MLANIKKLSRNMRGYTVVELNISLVVLGILITSILAIIVNYFVIMTRDNEQINLTTNSQSVLRAMVEQIRFGAGVRNTNEISDPNGPPGGWTTSNANFVIIIAVPALNTLNEYIIDPLTGDPYMNELVYYKQGDELWRRTLAHPSAPLNRLKTTCPPASASAACPADTETIDKGLKDMVFTFYDQDDNVTANPSLTRSVKINLQMEKDSFGQPLVFDNSIRVTLRNQFE